MTKIVHDFVSVLGLLGVSRLSLIRTHEMPIYFLNLLIDLHSHNLHSHPPIVSIKVAAAVDELAPESEFF
jgi:hypothetical protein